MLTVLTDNIFDQNHFVILTSHHYVTLVFSFSDMRSPMLSSDEDGLKDSDQYSWKITKK